MRERESIFTSGEFEAARILIACLAQHARHESFNASSVGFEFEHRAEAAAGYTDTGEPVTAKDFIRSALKLLLGQTVYASILSGISVEELIQALGIAVASDDPNAQ